MGFVKVALKGGEELGHILSISAALSLQSHPGKGRKKEIDVIGICNSISKDSAEARSGGS